MKAYLGKMANNTYQLSMNSVWNGGVSGFASDHITFTPSKLMPKLRKGQMIQVCLFVDSEILKVEEE